MQTSYAQKNETTQRAADNTAAAVHDNSPQSESLQRKASLANAAVQRAENPPRPNNTGLPDDLKNGVESLSGYSLDNVRVHYNSPKPATVQALAYTQGTDIHVAPGQEHALPHEAWHVAQQMAGRVTPTTNIGGMPVNDNAALEHEADVMGEKAVTQRKVDGSASTLKSVDLNGGSVQRMPSSLPKDYEVEGDASKGFVSGCTIKNKEVIDVSGEKDSQNGKAAALMKIAEEAGKIGGNQVLGLTDDENFFAKISAKYKTRNGKNVTLTLKYEFRKNGVKVRERQVGGPGYIVEVEKTRKEGVELKGKMVNTKKPGKGEYSNRHDDNSSDSILNDSYHDKTNSNSDYNGKNFDAYTKLAGEGARFLCVRRNIPWINNDTVFYSPGEGEGVKFSELWKTWANSFDKQYNIGDDRIKDKLNDEKGGKKKGTLLISKKSGVKKGSETTGTVKKRSETTETYTTPVSIDKKNSVKLDGKSLINGKTLYAPVIGSVVG